MEEEGARLTLQEMIFENQREDSGLGSLNFDDIDCSHSDFQGSLPTISEAFTDDVNDFSNMLCSFGNLNLEQTTTRVQFSDSGHEISECILQGETPDFLSDDHVCEFYKIDADGDTVLHLSIIRGERELTKSLIRQVPSCEHLDLANHHTQTALHLAVITRQPAIVRHLICAGARVDIRDRNGNTPLHVACAYGFPEVAVHFLRPVTYEETLEFNHQIPFQKLPPDAETRNYEGLPCLHLAASSRNLLTVRMLLSAGCDVNCREAKSGRSVLHLAAELGFTELLHLLLNTRGIQLDAKTYAGHTAIQLALGRGNTDVVHLLLRYGAAWDGHTGATSSDSD